MTYKLKSASSAKIGKKFKVKRIELGLSITEVAEKLFINKNYLMGIEEGDYSIFPSESFAKAYFKKYLEYLDIEIDFPSIYDNNTEKKHKKISREIRFNSSLEKNFLYIASSLLIAISIFIYFLMKTNSIDNNLTENQITSFKDIALIYDKVNQNNITIMPDDSSNIENKLLLEFIDECWIELYLDVKLIEA